VEGGGGVGGGQGVVEENRKGRNLRRGQTSPLYLLEHCPLIGRRTFGRTIRAHGGVTDRQGNGGVVSGERIATGALS